MPAIKELVQIGRLAFRHEGEWWNAYYALPDSMDKAIHVASIRIGSVQADAILKNAFMDTMKIMVSNFIKDQSGLDPTWGGPNSAPESERSGNA